MIVSICIPTYHRAELVRATLDSIVGDGVEPEKYEIVISDNSDDDKTLAVVDSYVNCGVRLRYRRNSVKGFYNSLEALKLGEGDFLKLQNDYSKFAPGGFAALVATVEASHTHKPQILFTDGNIRGFERKSFNSFDLFFAASSYWNTWSSAFSIWKSDFDSIVTQSMQRDYNSQFPHLSLLLKNTGRNTYLIENRRIYENLTVEKKGGYNLFKLFAVIYIEMLESARRSEVISMVTYDTIRKALKRKFLPHWYWRTVLDQDGRHNFSFSLADLETNLSAYHTPFECREIIFCAYLFLFRERVRKALAQAKTIFLPIS